MWESRPLPKIVRDPLAAHSARGSFFVPAPPGIFCLGDARQTPGDLKREKLAGRKTFLEKGSPSPPSCSPLSLPKIFIRRRRRIWWPADSAAAGTINGQGCVLSGFDERKGSVPGILAPGTLPFLLWGNGGRGRGHLFAVSGDRRQPKGLPMVDAGVLRGPAAEIWGSPCPVCS